MGALGRMKALAKRQQEIHSSFPLRINVEPTNACNMRCRICPRSKNAKPVGRMDFDLFKKIIDEIGEHPGTEVRLHKDGEPLLHPQIVDFIRYVDQRCPRSLSDMATNGHFLDEERGRGIIEAGLDVLLVSINAPDSETYQEVRNSKDFELVRTNVIKFLELKKKLGSAKPKVKLQLVLTRETVYRIGDFKRMWEGYDAQPVLAPFINWGGDAEGEGDRLVDFRKRFPCNFLWNVFSIDWNGDATFCNVDYTKYGVIGSLKDSSISELWRGPELRRYRDAHLAGRYDDLPLCARCNYWSFNPKVWVKIGDKWI